MVENCDDFIPPLKPSSIVSSEFEENLQIHRVDGYNVHDDKNLMSSAVEPRESELIGADLYSDSGEFGLSGKFVIKYSPWMNKSSHWSTRIKEVNGEQCLARCTIFRWCERYEAGLVNIKDLPRLGQEQVMNNSATISAVDELLWQNRRITTREIAVELWISKGTVHHIIHKKLVYGKVCAQWVPKNLSENQKTA
ncbi:hypothetical protein AVEN_130010-1 [Araneus ventricosus]|uniref:Mos1 transposase HTH domain-containing protein n=1 Tax=Araneus ventricosus TaxID=182803 RepID=A0A4Y2T4F8_ARAVE|nr:hypothetical protein AVEN_130010-1 [Araneus ventricosus]